MAVATGQCMDAWISGSYEDVQTYSCASGNRNQMWSVSTAAQSGYFVLKDVATGRCLDVTNGGTTAGTTMGTTACSGATKQMFKAVATDTGRSP